jgi:hypothetical protein
MIFKLFIVGFVVSVVVGWWLWRGVVKINNKAKVWLKEMK